jgi:hypothetical protein
MGFFGPGAATVKSLHKDLTKLKATRTELAARLDKHRSAFDEREKAVRAALIADDQESVIAKAEAARDEAKRRIGSVESALAELDAKIAETVKAHDDLVTSELAERIAIEQESRLASYRERFAALLSAARELLPAAESMGETAHPARELACVLRSLVLMEFPVSLERAEAEVLCYIGMLRSGQIRPELPRAAAPVAPMPVKPAVSTRRLYSLTALEWPAEDGSRVTRGVHEFCDVPCQYADIAVAKRRAVEMDDPKLRAYVREFGQGAITSPPVGHPLNGQLDNPDLKTPVAAMGRDIAAQAANMHDSHGRTFSPQA